MPPELSREMRLERWVDGKRGAMHLGPRLPSRISVAKSMCMRVTSGGNIAAPGPTLTLSN